jgi:hypothetical protein
VIARMISEGRTGDPRVGVGVRRHDFPDAMNEPDLAEAPTEIPGYSARDVWKVV